jgi:hypothetical protein
METRHASPELEAFIDEGIKLSIERGYHPTIFVGMRHTHGTIDAIERLVQSPDIQTGFHRLHQLNLLEWTIEAAVRRFPSEFSNDARQCAEWRLQQVHPR